MGLEYEINLKAPDPAEVERVVRSLPGVIVHDTSPWFEVRSRPASLVGRKR